MAMVSPQSDNTAEQEALSAYIDNQLSDTERVALERRLQSDGRLQAELNELRAVKLALRDLPSIVPPRSFTLDPATVRGPVRLPLFQWLRLGSVLATMLLVLTFTLDFIASGPRSMSPASAPMSALGVTTAPAAGMAPAAGGAAPLSASDEQPTVAAAAPAEATERNQANSSALGQETSVPAAAAPAATSAPAAAAPTAASEAGPAATVAPAAPLESGQMAASEPTVPPEIVPPAPVHASDSSSPGTDSSALPVPKQQARTQNALTNAPLRWLQLVLGIVAAALALGAWIIRRREHT